MGAYKDQAKGTAREIKGKIKEEYGDVTDNPRLEDEGRQEKQWGRWQKDAGRAQGVVQGAAREVKGAAKSAAGRLTDNERLRGEGEAERVAGKIERKLNK